MYKRREIEYKELIELFAIRTIDELKSGKECPKLNIALEQDGILLLNEVKDYPFRLKGYWTMDIDDDVIKKFSYENNCDENLLTLHIRDSREFFRLLTEITNKALYLHWLYMPIDEREYCMNILRRIWLRMSPNDFNDVIGFLKRQLSFVNNNWQFNLKGRNHHKVDEFYGRNVSAGYYVSNTYDETFYEVDFRIINLNQEESQHSLARVRYGITEEDNEKVCYIYALQNIKHPYRNKVIERQLYKRFAKNDYGVHPNQIYAMYLFLKELQKSGINKVKLPLLQVLNYDYHEIMYKEKDDVIDRCDKISKLKTEKLLMVMEVMQELFEDFLRLNDLDTISDTWDYSFKSKKNNEKIMLKENR